MAKHSTVGASSASRWMNCPGSVALCAQAPRTTSIYASEGTAAHKMAERCLEQGLAAITFLGHTIKADNQEFKVDGEMVDAVQQYLDEVRYWAGTSGSRLEIEKPLDLSWLHPGMFGTADAVVVHKDWVHVLDYKHGRGVAVDIERNAQAMYYALGALGEGDKRGDIEVHMTIVQPRAYHADGPIRTATMSAKDLRAWGQDVLLPAVKATQDPNAPVSPGEWCRFCDAKPICKGIEAHALKTAQQAFSSVPAVVEDVRPPAPASLSPERIGRILAAGEVLEDWLKGVREHAANELKAGRPIPGWKLVHGRSTRKWSDEGKAAKALVTYIEPYEKPKLKSPAQAEKALKAVLDATTRKEVLEPLTHKPEGALTLAPDSDKRPAATRTQSVAAFMDFLN